jgi:hypothetical protein
MGELHVPGNEHWFAAHPWLGRTESDSFIWPCARSYKSPRVELRGIRFESELDTEDWEPSTISGAKNFWLGCPIAGVAGLPFVHRENGDRILARSRI